MVVDGYRLGVDFGTSNTVAVLAAPDGSVRPLLFDGLELLPSAVCADPASGLLTGRDALHAARGYPECFEPNPKRRIDEGTVLLGSTEVAVVDLIAAVLARVAVEARRVAGELPREVTLTCPAAWGPRRQRVLLAAARAAGLGEAGLVTEPVAAARYFVGLPGVVVPPGACVVVYDFGAGTFDASVLRRGEAGFEVLAAVGLPDAGGLDVDAAIVAALGMVHAGRDAAAWRQLAEPATPAEQRAARLLWDDVRTGKEMLSRAASTLIHIPLVDQETPLGREQFEQLARPIVDRTVAATQAALREAAVGIEAVAGLFLVGGSSRIPLVATLLHRSLGVAPTVLDKPELVVAEGSLRPLVNSSLVDSPAVEGPVPVPVVAAPAPVGPPAPARRPPRRFRRRTVLLGLLVTAVILAIAQTAHLMAVSAAGTPTRLSALAHDGEVTAAAFSSDGTILATGVGDGTAVLTDVADPAHPRRAGTLTGFPGPVVSLAFSPDHAALAAASVRGSGAGAVWDMSLWDVSDRAHPTRRASLPTNRDAYGCVAFDPTGSTLATCSLDHAAVLWDVHDRVRPSRLALLADSGLRSAHALAFSLDGKALATAGTDGTAGLWNVTDRTRPTPTATLRGHADGVQSVAFSPDGQTLATASLDKSAILFDVASGARIGQPLTGQIGALQGVAFSSDGRRLATASGDGTAWLWDVSDRTRPHFNATLTGHTRALTVVAFSPAPGRRILATASADRTLVLWAVPAS